MPNFVAGNTIIFQDNTTVANDVASTWNWTFGDGTSSNIQNPSKIFQNPGNYNVKLIVTSLNGCSKEVNKVITILNNVTPAPTATLIQEFCLGISPTIANLIVTGINLKWYNSLISINPLPTTTVLTNSDIYYVSQTISGCESPRLGIEVRFFRSPTPIGNELQYFCSTNNPTIQSITIQGTSILWYSSIFTTTPLSNNTPLVNGQSYYASQNNGCGESPIRLKVTVSFDGSVINGNPIQKFCQIDNPTVADLILNYANIIWFTSATGGTQIANNTPLQNDLTYFGTNVDLQNCIPRFAVKVVLDNLNIKGSNFNQFLCDDSNAILQNVTNFNPKKWYNSPTSQTEINPNEKVTDGSVYYYSQIDPISGCENPERYQVKINLIPCDVEVFNAITINNNNQNDFLSIKNIEYFVDNSIEIFDKYGKLVYKTEKYGVNNNLFYGISKGNDVILKNKKLPTGTYYYVLNIKNNAISINKTKKGFIYIINNE